MTTETQKFVPLIPELDLSERADLFTGFSREAQRHLISARNALLLMETNPTDKQSLENIFKVFHTLEGAANFLNLRDIHYLSHETGIMLEMTRKNHLKFNDGVAPLVSTAVNSLQKFFELLDEQIANNGKPKNSYPNVGDLIMKIQDLTNKKIPDEKSNTVVIRSVPTIHFEPDMSSCTQIEKKLKASRGDLDIDKGMLQKLISSFQETSRELSEAQSKLLERERELIKERKLAVKLTQQAQTEAKTKSEYLASMSHEIRTLINAILGFTDLLKESILNARQKEHLDTIVLSGNMLLKIVNDILDFSKVEAGKLKLEKIKFSIRDIVEEVFRIIRSRLAGKPVNLYFDVHDNVPDYFVGDPVRLKQIFINLLDNAIKFTETGEIGLKVSIDQEHKTFVGQRVLRFVVADTGIGIPEDRRAAIFESFTQASDSTTRLYGGSGLGLALCKTFVEKMGGKIRVDSKPGEGSQFIFTITFPEQEGELKESIPTSPLLRDFSGTEIMIVGGHESSFQALTALCRDNQLKTFPLIQSVREASKFLLKRETGGESLPAIIFIDVMLPGKEGFMLAYKIKQQEQYKNIKLIAVSCDVKVDTSGDFKQAGFDALLVKPIIKSEAIEAILRLLGVEPGGRRFISKEMVKEISCAGIRVLVAEDSLPNQELLKIHFESLGCIYDHAANGQEAVDKLRNQSYDICFMDLQMPVMGGIKATKIIREELRVTIPIIALTAAEIQEEKEKCREAGMHDYLSKPFGIDELKEKIIQCTKM